MVNILKGHYEDLHVSLWLVVIFLKIHLDRFDGICMVLEIQAVVTSSLEGLNVTELNDTFSVLWFLKCQKKNSCDKLDINTFSQKY